MKKLLSPVAAILLLTACGSEPKDAPESEPSGSSAEESTTEPAVDTASAAPTGFLQCRTCHTVDSGAPNGIGPNLWDISGKPAAQKAGFVYSPAMKSSGLTWDAATLDKYLKEPMKTVPGTKMAYAGLRDDTKRAEVITYLETLKD